MPYKAYEVVQPMEVQSGKIKPWFDEKDGGIKSDLRVFDTEEASG